MWIRRLPFFYGWIIVAVAFVCYAVGYATWHSFSIFYVAILQDFGWSRAATAGAFSVFTIVYGIFSIPAGGTVDRFGPRLAIPVGAVVLGIGLLLVTRLTSIWEFYLLYGVVAAVGLSTLGTVPTFTVLNNWFVKKRGAAGGFATAGIGVGTLVMVPFLQSIITNYGWRSAYVVLAVAILLLVPVLSATFYRYRPQEVGLSPDGEAPKVEKSLSRAEAARADDLVVDKEWASREWTLGSASRTRRFWLIVVARFLELAAVQMLLTQQAIYFVDRGFDAMLAASVVGTVGIVGSVGKIMWGLVTDRIGRELGYFMAYGFGTVGVAIILSIQAGSAIWTLYAYAIVYGICYGASAVILPTLTADIFHSRHFGTILGGVYLGANLGSAAGPFFAGLVFDLTRSYFWAFAMAIPAMWISATLFWIAAPRKVRLVAGRARKAAPAI